MAQQEGLNLLKEKYFDIMLVGMTGQGKSTMADKLLIANPAKIGYVLPNSVEPNVKQDRVQLEDISMWLLHEDSKNQDIETHLKALVYFRTKPEPHAEVNGMRDPKNNILTGTSSCQVFSNDTTKMRILDVPGFEDERAFSPSSASSSQPKNRLYQTANSITAFNLGITRNIIRIQSTLGMCFRRVVYFLPCRGPLERASSLLKSELQQLEIAFGRSVFECMVAVATIPKRYSLREEEEFPQEDVAQCKTVFQGALRDVLDVGAKEAEPIVPIIFISLAESCESILEKVKGATVSCDGLKLRFNPSTCASCGVRIGSLIGEKVTCSTPQDPEGSIPYEESTCHPAFKRTLLSYVLGRRITEMITRKWPSYKEEYCIECDQRPGESGCLKIGQKYRAWWGKVYPVDHTSEVIDPLEESIPEADRSGAGAQGIPPTYADDHPELQADHFGGETCLQVHHLVGADPHVEASTEDRKGT